MRSRPDPSLSDDVPGRIASSRPAVRSSASHRRAPPPRQGRARPTPSAWNARSTRECHRLIRARAAPARPTLAGGCMDSAQRSSTQSNHDSGPACLTRGPANRPTSAASNSPRVAVFVSWLSESYRYGRLWAVVDQISKCLILWWPHTSRVTGSANCPFGSIASNALLNWSATGSLSRSVGFLGRCI
jgi:hypothetical protein